MQMEEAFESGRSTGTRVLAPFLDADLVDFLYRTPPNLLSRGGRSKGLVRESLARRFPALGFERQRKIAGTTYARFVMQGQTSNIWRQMGGVPALAELGVVDGDGFERHVVEASDPGYLDGFHIWDMLNLEAWLRSQLEREG
jgi:asparagine synthetase B (glutamine-hydrolysing)